MSRDIFGWDLPPGVTPRDIDNAVGVCLADPPCECSTPCEACETHGHVVCGTCYGNGDVARFSFLPYPPWSLFLKVVTKKRWAIILYRILTKPCPACNEEGYEECGECWGSGWHTAGLCPWCQAP